MHRATCPGRQELSAYALGMLDEAAAEQIERHLASCPACEQALSSLDALSDGFVCGLREAGRESPDEPVEESPLADPLYRTAVENARAMIEVVDTEGGDEEEWSADPFVNTSLGPYVLRERIGSGGLGVVYRAVHQQLGTPVAIKVLRADRLPTADVVARFRREMATVSTLDHPHLVRAYDAGQTGDRRCLFLVTELIEGTDLKRLVEQTGPLPVTEACQLVRQAAVGLEYLHRQGYVHRDVKPSNLMRAHTGEIKILDLGLALLVERQASDVTSDSRILGTPDYLAPEQSENSHRVDGRADIYSLGCTLYFLLTGQPAYSGKTPLQQILLHREAPVPRLSAVRPDVSPALERLLQRMLAKRVEDRHGSMGEVIADLDAVLSGGNISPGQEKRRPGKTWRVPLRLSAKPVATCLLAVFLALILLAVCGFMRLFESLRSDLLVPEGSVVAAHDQPKKMERSRPPEAKMNPAAPSVRPPPPAAPPMEFTEAKRCQSAWALHLGLPVETVNSIGMKFALIPPGQFDMGTPDSEIQSVKRWAELRREPMLEQFDWEGPVHRVQITQPFYLGVCEVTRDQFAQVTVGTYAERFAHDAIEPGQDGDSTGQWPVGNVLWGEANEFCRRLCELPEEKTAGRLYRLPTEAEWEYACRTGTTTRWACGDDTRIASDYQWVGYNSPGNLPQRVACKFPNAWGLYDMHGNVVEWCSDWFGADYYRESPGLDPTGPPEGTHRIYRGGCAGSSDTRSRSAARLGGAPYTRDPQTGFRVVWLIQASPG